MSKPSAMSFFGLNDLVDGVRDIAKNGVDIDAMKNAMDDNTNDGGGGAVAQGAAVDGAGRGVLYQTGTAAELANGGGTAVATRTKPWLCMSKKDVLPLSGGFGGVPAT